MAALHNTAPGTHCTGDLGTHNSNLITKKLMSFWCKNNNVPNKSQFCTCNDNWAHMTYAKLRPDWIIRMEVPGKRIVTSFQLWGQGPFVKWPQRSVASFTKEVNPRLAKRPLKTNGRLANRGSTSLVKEATVSNGVMYNERWEWGDRGRHQLTSA